LGSVQQYLVDHRHLWCEWHRQRHGDVQFHTQRKPERSHGVTHCGRKNRLRRAEWRRRQQ
jgi:hypothetical protein